MPQPDRPAYQPSKRTEEFVYEEVEGDEAPLVMTIRASLTHGEIDPLRQWWRSLLPDPDDFPDPDEEQTPQERRARRKALRDRIKLSENVHAWPLVAPFVLGWNVIDADGRPVPPPTEGGPDVFRHIPNEAFGDVLFHFLKIPQQRVDAARKASGASAASDAPSPATSSPDATETTPSP